MSKRILALLLLVTMLMSVVLTSCSSLDEDYEEDTSTVKEITLTFYGVKGEGTTDAAVDAVEAKINEYTKKNYKTTLDLKLFDEEEYDEAMADVYAKLDAQRERDELAEEAANAAAKVAREAAKKLEIEDQKEKKRAQRAYEKWAEDNVVEDETSVEMDDDVVLDIFLMRGFDNYLTAVEEEKLADLSSYANGTYKLIYKYTSPIVIQAAKRNGVLYGVPSNKLLATEDNESYYYAVRTDLLEKYGVTIEENEIPYMDNKFATFFEQVKANESCEVLLAPPKAIQNFDFYLDDMETYPLYGTRSNETTATNSTTIEFTYKVLDPNDLGAGVANSHYKKMASYRSLGYFAPEGATVENTNFAMGIFYGTLDSVRAQLGAKADDYTYCIYKCARTTNDVVFKNLLTVSADCKYPDRAFQIIAALHTVPELRNLITFGIEGVNYMVNEDNGKTITKLNNDYNIGFEVYGNSLIGYIPEELGADYQVTAAKKNSEVKVSAYLGYTPELEAPDLEAVEAINAVGREYQTLLMNGAADVEAVYEEAMTNMGKKENVLNLYLEAQEEDAYVPPYTMLMQALSSDYSTYTTNRPPDKQVPNNDFLSKEETDRRAAIEREKEEILIKATEALEEGQILDRETGDVIIEETGEVVKNVFVEAEALKNAPEEPVDEAPEAEIPVEGEAVAE